MNIGTAIHQALESQFGLPEDRVSPAVEAAVEAAKPRNREQRRQAMRQQPREVRVASRDSALRTRVAFNYREPKEVAVAA